MDTTQIIVAAYCLIASAGSFLIETRATRDDANPMLMAGLGAIVFPVLLLDFLLDDGREYRK